MQPGGERLRGLPGERHEGLTDDHLDRLAAAQRVAAVDGEDPVDAPVRHRDQRRAGREREVGRTPPEVLARP